MKILTINSNETLLKALLFLSIFLISVEGNSQFFNSPMDHSQSLGKGKMDVSIGYQRYNLESDFFSGNLSDNIALRFGRGMTENIDVQVRYERIDPSDGLNFISITPKFSFASDHFAFFLPIGHVFGAGSSLTVISSTLMYTKRTSQKFELSLSTGSDFNTEEADFVVDFNLGFGFSSDLDKWSVRPEFGILANLGENGYIWNFGVAFAKGI